MLDIEKIDDLWRYSINHEYFARAIEQAVREQLSQQPPAVFMQFDDKGEFVTARLNHKGLVLDSNANYVPYWAAPGPAAAQELKDHEIATLINSLRDIAIKYTGTGQLRERIAAVIRPVFKTHPQRITEQDAKQIAYSYLDYFDEEKGKFEDWLNDETYNGRSLLDKLNGVIHD